MHESPHAFPFVQILQQPTCPPTTVLTPQSAGMKVAGTAKTKTAMTMKSHRVVISCPFLTPDACGGHTDLLPLLHRGRRPRPPHAPPLEDIDLRPPSAEDAWDPGVRSCAGVLFPLIMMTFIFIFHRELLEKLRTIPTFVSFFSALIIGLFVMIVMFLAARYPAAPVTELVLPGSFSLLVFSHASLPGNQMLSYAPWFSENGKRRHNPFEEHSLAASDRRRVSCHLHCAVMSSPAPWPD